MNWGINPLMGRQFPAMLEYYYDTATDQDYFFAGCSGAGYCYPDDMPNVEQFARHTAEACQQAGIDCVDLWGARRHEVVERYASVVKPLALTINARPSRVTFLRDGTPVGYHELAYWQEAALGGDTNWVPPFRDDARRAEAVRWLVTRIEDIADRHYPPFVILVYADLHGYDRHCGLVKEICEALDDRFKPARLDEAFAAMRAWAEGKVLLGAPDANQKPEWAALQGVPTLVPLALQNCSDQARRVRVSLHCEGAPPQRAHVELGPRETRAVESFRLILPGGEAPEPARLNLVSGDLRERYEVALCVVPWQGAAREAELAGVWRAVSLQHRSGSAVADTGVAGGKAWASPAPEGEAVHIVYGPYAELAKGK
ncbi:MAG: hypothetical protein J7M26_09855, partial [Armatimonadetes bacterium]|nr:hypothetical protein [Armatimonadota bacterium]